jgi:eukaryotic-like serine/threonine-protein kinase
MIHSEPMADEGSKPPPTDDGSSTGDAFLRALARASSRPPPSLTPDPARLAHFRIESRLGVGGMGIVYRAVDEKLKRPVALKVLPEEFADRERQRRFLREARSAAAITHPNIATVYDVGEAEGHIFIAMELIEGDTLRERIERGLSVAESLLIAKEIARGLGRAHAKGIVHRDLKPENVMISNQDEVKILDFGLAKLDDLGQMSTLSTEQTEENLTLEGRVVGTPAYMSPEQTLGEVVDARSDIFSFGIVLFEMLTGTRPFHGATAIAVMMSAGRDAPKRPSELNPMVPVEVDRIVGRCLEKVSALRYANGDELRSVLDAVNGARSSLSGATTLSAAPRMASSGPPASGAAKSQWARARLLGGFIAVASLLTAGVLALRPKHDVSVETTAARGDESAPSPSVIGLLDSPPPATKSPEAAAEYRRAMTDIRDAIRPPQTALRRAVQLDPEFAAAHLRLAMWWMLPPTSTREYGEALRLRDRLDARDNEILYAEEPAAAGVPSNLVEAERRYTALVDKRPKDLEILLRLATLRGRLDAASARPTLEIASGLAPSMPGIELAAGDNEKDLDSLEMAQRHYERCLALSSGATRCMSRLARLGASSGRCDVYEQEVKRILVLEPASWFFRRDGLGAALATGASEDSVRAAIAGALSADSPALRGVDKELLEGDAALWRGSMLLARDAFDRAERVDRDQGESTALTWTFPQRLTIAEELGDADSIRSILRAYVGARSLTTENAYDDTALRGLRAHHVIPDEELLQLRDRWRRDMTNVSAPLLWLRYEASIAATEQEAVQVLASGLAPKISHDELDVNATLGHVLVVAQRYADAASRLEPVARNCAIFRDDRSYVTSIVPAAYDLGEAREGLGDFDAACAAYKRVVDLWGRAVPRSRTAEAARARRVALRCVDGS